MNEKDIEQGIILGPREILAEIEAAKENRCLLGIWSTRLGNQMLMCVVESIYRDHRKNDKAIIVREKNLLGSSLQTHLLYLKEIAKVHRFKIM